jgi:hypothetical protein
MPEEKRPDDDHKRPDDQGNVLPFRKARRRRVTARTTKRDSTEHLQFRLDSKLSDEINQIVASQVDADLKTRSDVLHDAVAFWLDEWTDEHPNTSIARRWRLERRLHARECRDAYLEVTTFGLERACKEHDDDLVREIFIDAHLEMATFLAEKASPVEVAELQTIIDLAKAHLQ